MQRARRVALLILAATGGPAAATSQTLDLSLPAARFTVGDPIDIACSIRIPRGATLLDPVPRLLDALPPDITIARVDTLHPRGDAYVGRLRLTVLRTGLQNLPVFYVRYRRAAAPGAPPDTLVSRPLPIEIASVLPPGRLEPRDVQRLEPVGGGSRVLWWPAVLAVGAAVALVVWRRRRSRADAAPAIPPPQTAALPDPYQVALARLAEIEAAAWPARGAVDRHYDLVTDALRRYLAEAAGIDALERTTAELIRLLPPPLVAADGCRGLLAEADLVKFARARPDAARAAAYLGAVRTLLSRWHDVLVRTDAIR
jgi:hypothetical protein